MAPTEPRLFLTTADRRRLAVATVVTVVALPALWLASRDSARDGTGAPAVAAVGAGGAVGGSAAGPGATTPDVAGAPATTLAPVEQGAGPLAETETDALSDALAVFLDGPSSPPAPVVLDVAVPTTDAATSATGLASYDRSSAPGRCDTPLAPANATLVVTNVNNGRSVSCTNRFTYPSGGGVAIVLDESVFLSIADLVDAPVPVRITW